MTIYGTDTITARAPRVCTVDGCDRPSPRSQRRCGAHDSRLRKYGTTDAPPGVISMAVQREAIARLGDPSALEPGECWEWPAKRQARGYGIMAPSLTVVRSHLVHRNAYAIAYGDLPDDLEVCHRCDNRPCYRPSHLFAGTHADNMRDMAVKGRSGARPGITSPHAKFSLDDVAEIHRLHGTGLTYTAIARRYGVHLSTIRRIISGETQYHGRKVQRRDR